MFSSSWIKRVSLASTVRYATAKTHVGASILIRCNCSRRLTLRKSRKTRKKTMIFLILSNSSWVQIWKKDSIKILLSWSAIIRWARGSPKIMIRVLGLKKSKAIKMKLRQSAVLLLTLWKSIANLHANKIDKINHFRVKTQTSLLMRTKFSNRSILLEIPNKELSDRHYLKIPVRRTKFANKLQLKISTQIFHQRWDGWDSNTLRL